AARGGQLLQHPVAERLLDGGDELPLDLRGVVVADPGGELVLVGDLRGGLAAGEADGGDVGPAGEGDLDLAGAGLLGGRVEELLGLGAGGLVGVGDDVDEGLQVRLAGCCVLEAHAWSSSSSSSDSSISSRAQAESTSSRKSKSQP